MARSALTEESWAWAGQVAYADDIVGSDHDIVAMIDESAETDSL